MSFVFNMIKREMADKGITQTELARKLNIRQSSVQGMFKSNSIKVHRLIEISKILDYNFFGEIAQRLSVKNPALELSLKLKEEEMNEDIDILNDKINKLNTKIEQLKREKETLQAKFELLESVIEKIGGK